MSGVGRGAETGSPISPSQYYIDGALTTSLPFAECPRTITVTPFHVTADICPQSASPNFLELISCKTSFQFSIFNVYYGIRSVLPAKIEVGIPDRERGRGRL